MKASAVYRKAAEAATNNSDFSCNLVGRISMDCGGNYFGKPREDYVDMFGFDGKNQSDLWQMPPDEIQNVRVLALLLMSEIAKDQSDLPN